MGKKIVIKLIRFYQLVLSPYKGRSYCNYVPSCSQYAVEAIDMYGVILGGWLAFKRILRCNLFIREDLILYLLVNIKEKDYINNQEVRFV